MKYLKKIVKKCIILGGMEYQNTLISQQ